MIKYRSWSPLEQETYNTVGNNPDLHLNQFQIINKAKLKNPRLDWRSFYVEVQRCVNKLLTHLKIGGNK